MAEYTELIKALRCNGLSKECDSCGYGYHLSPDSECNDACRVERIISDAADAIEELETDNIRLEHTLSDLQDRCMDCEKQMPKRGHWEPVPDAEGRPYKYVCSNCHRFHVNEDEWYGYCPNCGAVMGVPIMDGPIITPCRGCSDYDGYGGCKSKGGCARAKMEVQDG